METKQLSNHQVGVILSLSIISLKILIFPAVIGGYSLNNCYISVAVSLLVDFLFVLLLLYVMKKNPNLTFFKILENKFGVVVAKITGVMLGLFFLLKSVMAIKELQNYFVQLLFEDIDWFLFVIPLLALLIYIMSKSLRTFGRSVEFFYYVIVVGALLSIILPIKEIRSYNLLPFLPDGLSPILKGSFLTAFQYADFLVLLICMGNFKYNEKTPKTILKFTLFTDLFLIAFFVVFVAFFGNTVVNQGLAISDIPLYSNMAYNNGRLEWLSIIIWTIVLIMQTGLMLKCASVCVGYVTNIKNNIVVAFIVSAIDFIILLVFYLNFALAIKIVVSVPFASMVLALQIVIIVMLLVASKGRNYERIVKECA